MMKCMVLVILSVVGMLAGCTPAMPKAEYFPPSKQKVAVAAQHWGMIASDAVQQTRVAMEKQNFPKNKPVYVVVGSETEFEKAFRNYLITGLVNAGVAVSPASDGAIEINYETQVIRHAGKFDADKLGYKPGMATAGVAGFWVLRNAVEKWSMGVAAAGTIGAAAAYDYYKIDNPEQTGVELLLTTSIIQNQRYVMRHTDAYYVEKADASLFESCKGKSRRACRSSAN